MATKRELPFVGHSFDCQMKNFNLQYINRQHRRRRPRQFSPSSAHSKRPNTFTIAVVQAGRQVNNKSRHPSRGIPFDLIYAGLSNHIIDSYCFVAHFARSHSISLALSAWLAELLKSPTTTLLATTIRPVSPSSSPILCRHLQQFIENPRRHDLIWDWLHLCSSGNMIVISQGEECDRRDCLTWPLSRALS